jgi:SPASM domain peptide maturase of grasp-with-spasm system
VLLLENKFPLLYASCIPVKGKTRAIICDIQRQAYLFIPNTLFEVLSQHQGKTLKEIKATYENKFNETIDEYFSFLIEKEYAFFADNPALFPAINLLWEDPRKLTNAIIDIGDDSKLTFHDYESIFSQLGTLGCEHIQIRSFGNRNLSFFETILKKIGTKRIISIELIIRYPVDLLENQFVEFCNQFPRVFSITLYGAPYDKVINTDCQNMGYLIFTKELIDSCFQCGVISSTFFTINMKSLTESQHHNTCLNRKISIDTAGNIKNCPSMQQSFGHISDTSLEEVIKNPNFTKVWNIKKDEIEKCKGCEFRHICTDCRAYLANPDDLYSAPLKCGYNPETCEWEEWSTNPLKQQAIEYYQLETNS